MAAEEKSSCGLLFNTDVFCGLIVLQEHIDQFGSCQWYLSLDVNVQRNGTKYMMFKRRLKKSLFKRQKAHTSK